MSLVSRDFLQSISRFCQAQQRGVYKLLKRALIACPLSENEYRKLMILLSFLGITIFVFIFTLIMDFYAMCIWISKLCYMRIKQKRIWLERIPTPNTPTPQNIRVRG